MSESTVTRLFFNFFSKKSNAASTKYLSKFHTLAYPEKGLYTQYVKGEQGEVAFIILFNSFLRLKRFLSLLLGV